MEPREQVQLVDEHLAILEQQRKKLQDMRNKIIEASGISRKLITNVSGFEFAGELVKAVKKHELTETEIKQKFSVHDGSRSALWTTLRKLTSHGILAHNYKGHKNEPYYYVRDLEEKDREDFRD